MLQGSTRQVRREFCGSSDGHSWSYLGRDEEECLFGLFCRPSRSTKPVKPTRHRGPGSPGFVRPPELPFQISSIFRECSCLPEQGFFPRTTSYIGKDEQDGCDHISLPSRRQKHGKL
ncbi:hypothetical protein RvY_07307-4 [Ramazzottius varieornatus]|uniref:Uncharacterized protein n=1 Tax=Ramazzottius varieornatus TaxID=947166 RepID=A0A1D1V4U8_RAMVA|nr:hypothetical protein RvY_07307-4 [Ramazzottius varieornatus]